MLDPNDKKQVKECFNDWLDMIEQRAELTSQVGDLKKNVASILDVESSMVTKLFNYMKKLYEDGTDELGDLKELIEDIKS